MSSLLLRLSSCNNVRSSKSRRFWIVQRICNRYKSLDSATTTPPVVSFSAATRSHGVGEKGHEAISALRRGTRWTRSFASTTAPESGEEEEEIKRIPWCSQPLGHPLPMDEHACSVSLPTWSSVVGYEEGDPAITTSMKCGYPRFVYHPYIIQLMQVILQRNAERISDTDNDNDNGDNFKEDCLVLPSATAAKRCELFLRQALEKKPITTTGNGGNRIDNALLDENTSTDSRNDSSSRIRVVSVGAGNVYAVLFPAETAAGVEAKAYWQHTGEVVSSRRAAQALQELGETVQPIMGRNGCGYALHSHHCQNVNDISSIQQLQDRIAGWTNVTSGHVFLTPSGMASIYTALRSARRYQFLQNSSSSGAASVVFGFPYLDTLKLCSRREFCPGGVEFFGRGDEDDLRKLQDYLSSSRRQVCALFTEVPSNPLLQCPNLEVLRQLADEYGFCLVVDDTIGNFANIELLHSGLADVLCTSLTKLVSGRGDVMAGSVVVNPNTEMGRWMQQDLLQRHDNEDLHPSDAQAMMMNSQDFLQRNLKINKTSEQLADWLQQHEDVAMVYYPKYAPYYSELSNNFGGLMSILLESHMCQRTFYDALNVAKGPSLGTNFTLVCPYTLLAHYHELDFAWSYNVPPNLLRIAVGLENIDELQAKFDKAFCQSRLYPKLSCQDPPGSS